MIEKSKGSSLFFLQNLIFKVNIFKLKIMQCNDIFIYKDNLSIR